MVRNPAWLYKTLVVGVIVLFIGVGIQPAFAELSIKSDNSELVEITVQFYETDRTYNHTVMLTQEQAEELENLINDFEIKIDNADNKKETEAVYKDTVVSLNEYGILPEGMSIEKAQRLVTGKEYNPVVVRLFERWYIRNHESMDDNENILCLIVGWCFDSPFASRGIVTITKPIWNFLYKALYDLGESSPLLEIICHDILIGILEGFFGLWYFRPFGIGFELYFGYKQERDGTEYYIPSHIYDIFSLGLNGIKHYRGDYYGQLPLLPLFDCFLSGAVGYTGIKMGFPTSVYYGWNFFLLGSALWFKIGEEHP